MRPADIERFEAFIWKPSNPDGCHVWLGQLDADDYGQFSFGSKTVKAHRFAFEAFVGAIPVGLCVLHVVCDNPRCVNPKHLRAGTNADNSADMVSKNRQAKGDRHGARTHPENLPRGEGNGSAKLTEDAVREIRALGRQGLLQRQIGERFGITQSNVGLIVARKTWAHVPDALAPRRIQRENPPRPLPASNSWEPDGPARRTGSQIAQSTRPIINIRSRLRTIAERDLTKRGTPCPSSPPTSGSIPSATSPSALKLPLPV